MNDLRQCWIVVSFQSLISSFLCTMPDGMKKTENLEVLINSQLNFKALASMSDHKLAIGANSQQDDDDIDMEVDDDDLARQEKLNHPSEEVQTNTLADPADNELFKQNQQDPCCSPMKRTHRKSFTSSE